MRENFDKSFEIVVNSEGGYVNDPDDPGGETKYGISKRAYPKVDIKNLTLDSAKDIYLRDYWVPAGCDNLDYPLDTAVFSCAVNCGVSRARKILAKSADTEGFKANWIAFYRGLNKPKYEKGWINRVNDLYEKVRT